MVTLVAFPLAEKFGIHFRATCGACRSDAEVCAKRLDGEGAKRVAVERLRGAGWHVDGLGTDREKWFCPACSKRTHL